jgi:hypothetical protein
LAVSAGCANAWSRPPTWAPTDLREDERAACNARLARAETTIELVRLDPAVRGAIGDVVEKNRIAAVRLSSTDCNVEVELLRCSRPIVYAPDKPPRLEKHAFDRRGITTNPAAGAGALTSLAESRKGLALALTTTSARRPSFYADVVDTGELAPWGSVDESVAPLLDIADLGGPDCARATHWIDSIVYGGYRIDALDGHDKPVDPMPVEMSSCQPPACSEPIAVHATRLLNSGCPSGQVKSAKSETETERTCTPAWRSLEWKDAREPTCVPAADVEPSEAFIRGLDHLDSGRFSDATIELEKVCSGTTGDEPVHRQRAWYLFALSAYRSGDIAGANAAMEIVARTPCHPKQAEAAYWGAVEKRRAYVPTLVW